MFSMAFTGSITISSLYICTSKISKKWLLHAYSHLYQKVNRVAKEVQSVYQRKGSHNIPNFLG